MDEPLTVPLYRYENGDEVTHVDALIDNSMLHGQLVISGWDMGSVAKKHTGGGDYEYFLRINPEQKPRMMQLLSDTAVVAATGRNPDAELLSLLQKKFAGKTAFSAIGDWCKENNITAKFGRW